MVRTVVVTIVFSGALTFAACGGSNESSNGGAGNGGAGGSGAAGIGGVGAGGPCKGDGDCTQPTPYCGPDGTCVQWLGDGNCGQGRPYCNKNVGLCVACVGDGNCANVDGRHFCDATTGQC